ncbi:response regulator transcription factor [Romboutsia lituseburensis]|uniref:Stage 0 sporulation protein A homolog n=1 Tax=Romboutsia lituseburensis DSM 797 TaxID=1121325 RepID=A0A1G9JFG6_9FIRM|nr:response regulator transcription factor [Romboutsia lituseburensis]CEH33509.1 Transcriptional regulator, LuxR [Romboutsia lituseburensis]SDL36319.1 DNA-binding response regulator, NarL/FixJ family, contains REC and HTH domains [Romboutsia lituseburensis DSM 797]
MQVIVISESLIIRRGIVQILSGEKYISSIKESHLYTDIYKEDYDLILIDLNKNNKQYLYDLEHLKKTTNTKVMVLDFYEDRTLFSKCMKSGIDGYILANIDSEDIGYAVKQLYRGKKYYDAELIENYIFKGENEDIEELTKREQEVLIYIAKGKTNIEISKELYITEHTVKKHTSNIFAKLNLKDRMQAALYAYNKGLVEF